VYPIAIQSGPKQTHYVAALLCALRSHVSFCSTFALLLPLLFFNSKERKGARKNDEAENFCGIFPARVSLNKEKASCCVEEIAKSTRGKMRPFSEQCVVLRSLPQTAL
jgi:hypothetical protein